MNPLKPDKIEWITLLALGPLLALLMNYLLFGNGVFSWKVLSGSFPFVLFYISCSWYLHVTVMHILRVKLPAYDQTAKRLIILYSSHIFLTSTSLYLIFFGYDYFHILGYVMDPAKSTFSVVIGVTLTFIATSTWEGTYIYQLWKESLREKELLQKMNLQSEFEALKSQVNPHFLFNSLNSLSSLIQENPNDAEKFLDEMSKVYRYILRNNEMELINLDTELKFLNSYYHLLKTRHSEGLILEINARKNTCCYFLPPLTLQILLENAVKHNVVLKDQPLTVTIDFDEGDRLQVRNNLQKKTFKVASNKVGLSNIAMKYRLLNQPEITIDDTGSEFLVSIPLIK